MFHLKSQNFYNGKNRKGVINKQVHRMTFSLLEYFELSMNKWRAPEEKSNKLWADARYSPRRELLVSEICFSFINRFSVQIFRSGIPAQVQTDSSEQGLLWSRQFCLIVIKRALQCPLMVKIKFFIFIDSLSITNIELTAWSIWQMFLEEKLLFWTCCGSWEIESGKRNC